MKDPKKWLAPKRPGIPSEHLPDPNRPHPTYRANADLIRDLVIKAKIPDQADALIGFVRDATRDYVRAQARDEAIAWPGQVLAFRDRISSAARLLEVNAGDPLPEVSDRLKATRIEATILRATSVSPFAFEDTRDLLGRLVADLHELIDGFGPPTKDSAVTPARQLALAKQFWGAFTTNCWPTNTNPKGLMVQCLKIVLEAAGEKRATLKDLLEKAKTA